MTFLPAVGGESLSLLFGADYDQHKTHEDKCIGHECFNFAFKIAFSLSFMTVLMNSFLVFAKFRERRQ